MFSKACTYAINALAYISAESAAGRRTSLKAIAAHINSPEAFTAKILQQLSRSNIIRSTVGAYGGFEIEKSTATETKLKTVVTLFDGDNIHKGCAMDFKNCNEKHPCLLHEKYKPIRTQIADMLETTSVLELGNKTTNKIAFLKQ